MSKVQYVLVADSSSARIYQSDARFTELTLIAQHNHPAGRMSGSELDTDRPGRRQGTRAGIHSVGGEDTSRQRENETFARELSQWLQAEHLAGKFTGLSIVAPPEFLGELRQQLSEDCAKVLVKTVNKNLMHEGDNVIIAHLV